MPYNGSSKYHGPSRNLNTEATGDGNDTTISDETQIVYCDTTTSTLTVTLPSEAEVDGKEVVIQDAGGNAGTNNVTVTAESGGNVDGSDQDLTLSTNYGSITVTYSSDESGWFSQ